MQEIGTLKGEAALMRVERIEPLSQEHVADLFRSERAAEYAAAVRACRDIEAQFGRGARSTGIERRLKAKLAAVRRELDRIERIDYLRAPAGEEARRSYEKTTAKLHRPRRGNQGAVRTGTFRMPPAGSLWVTRPRPHIDRIGSAWLITRFHDPRARFVFSAEPGALANATPFDVLGAEFGHHGEDCTFETLLKRLGRKERRLRTIAEIVHEADLADGKYVRPEVAGLDLMLKGVAALHADDRDLLTEGMRVFDALYSALPGRR
jgi:hypothetical protein